MTPSHPLRVLLMGVAGCGKSSVGEGLSARLAVPYQDGDDLHPPSNVAKMRAGIPLNDEDRWPWLDRVAETFATRAPLLLGCSALKRAYRDRIRAGAGGPVTIIHLSGAREVIATRMAARSGHYMPLALLDSQFAALEPPGPDEALDVSIDQPLDAILTTITSHLQRIAP
jgi:gluconokinase